MGMVIDGRWIDDDAAYRNPEGGAFVRAESVFRDRITADGSSGYPAEPGRYHLFLAPSCPWAHRTQIWRRLKGLEGVISATLADLPRARSWACSSGIGPARAPAPRTVPRRPGNGAPVSQPRGLPPGAHRPPPLGQRRAVSGPARFGPPRQPRRRPRGWIAGRTRLRSPARPGPVADLEDGARRPPRGYRPDRRRRRAGLHGELDGPLPFPALPV